MEHVGPIITDDRVVKRRPGDVAETRDGTEVRRNPSGQVHHYLRRGEREVERIDTRATLQHLDVAERDAVR